MVCIAQGRWGKWYVLRRVGTDTWGKWYVLHRVGTDPWGIMRYTECSTVYSAGGGFHLHSNAPFSVRGSLWFVQAIGCNI